MTMCDENRNGSRMTQADRKRILSLISSEISAAGFLLPSARSLKPKHVKSLLAGWKARGLGAGTMQNRMSALRWWAQKAGKMSMMKAHNVDYGIDGRKRDTADKGRVLDMKKIERVKSPHVRMSLRLQAAFGLRREEAIKLIPELADKGNVLALKGSWTKGGRYREVSITNDRQRALLEEAKALAEGGSLIPKDKDFVQQKVAYDNETAKAGLRNNHGLRHRWAQWRYKQLTGWEAPKRGGPVKANMSDEEYRLDRQAREQISFELGHSRPDVTNTYLGSAGQ
jgi:integrase